MVRIGLVTFHRSKSYGAGLQAFATVEFLKDNGYEVQLIDYTNPYEQRSQKLFYSENGKLDGYIKAFLKDFIFGKKYYAYKSYHEFYKYFPLTKEKYTSADALENVEYDVLIAGSDQVWNKDITNGLDRVMLLQFGKAKRRISVASSMGSIVLNEEDKSIFQGALQAFTSISIREEFGKKQLCSLTDKKIKVLMDPTFFFGKDEWIRKLGSKSKFYNSGHNYILTFFVTHNNGYRERVQQYADFLKIPIWSMQPTLIKRTNCEKSILGATTEDLIALIAGAALVITDSFHGVAMSLNLQRDFVAFKNVENPVRVETLLNKLDIKNRLDMKPAEYCKIDYKAINEKLFPLCEDSKRWVIEAIEK